MTTHNTAEMRICDAIWSIGVMLDYTQKIAGFVTPELLDWRPEFPAGDFAFSLGEQLMHITDIRMWIVSQLGTEKHAYERWAGPYPGIDQPWTFRAGSHSEVMEALESSRQLVQPWIERPMGELSLPTAGTVAAWEKALAAMREKGEDTSQLEAKGAGTLGSALFFLLAHENGHRTVTQTMLRMAGAPVERLA
ncbi:hypothetical protein KDL29_05520 [bacterium]|nr:hypothetical protein [bacterium]